ncbi:efflux RND transporter permease subunit [Salmonella enterica subsp. enterica]|nr:efflux RND transporter permease subunit [Salmonella enterica subsp. enterica]
MSRRKTAVDLALPVQLRHPAGSRRAGPFTRRRRYLARRKSKISCVWLDPAKIANRGLTASDIVTAL